MPLKNSSSKKAFRHNFEAEKLAGKNNKEALAIAFAKQREAKKAGK